jgi:hypothetical protein
MGIKLGKSTFWLIIYMIMFIYDHFGEWLDQKRNGLNGSILGAAANHDGFC